MGPLTLYGEPRVWLEQFPEGQASEVHRDHLGLRYRGEVIRAPSWSSSWGEPLDDGVYFRIVLMTRRNAALRPRISDPRIAVCLPAIRSSQRRASSTGELAAIRETQAIFLASGDADADLIRSTLRRRQEGLEQELLGEDSVRYSQGAVVTGVDSAIDATDVAAIFAGVDPNEWFQRLAARLLNQAYPTLPVETSSLSRAITHDDVPELYRAIFNQAGGNPEVLTSLGPALGLSGHATPGEFDASNCQPFDLLRDWLIQQTEPVDWRAASHYLAHEIGLTAPLANLYLLLFVYSESPPVEIRLKSRDNVSTVNGRPLLTSRLTNDLIPLLLWDPRMVERGAQISPESEPGWEDTIQHLSYLSTNLAANIQGPDTATAEAVLAHDLESLSQELSQSHSVLAQLYQATGEPQSPELADPLERLAVIIGDASAGFSEVYRKIRGLYTDPRLVEDDISAMHRLAGMGGILPEVLELRSYLDKVEVSHSAMPDLWVDRQGLQAALSLSKLIDPAGRTWESLNQEIVSFKSSYGSAYRSHHTQFHQSLPAYQRDLDAARRHSRAVALLNTIPELAGAEGLGLGEALEQLNDGYQCPVGGEMLLLEDSPICGSCEITLEQTMPVGELNEIGSAIEAAVAIKCQKLSELLMGKIIQDADDPRLDDFIRIVQTSDLSALSNTLNQDMVDFIRRLLA